MSKLFCQHCYILSLCNKSMMNKRECPRCWNWCHDLSCQIAKNTKMRVFMHILDLLNKWSPASSLRLCKHQVFGIIFSFYFCSCQCGCNTSNRAWWMSLMLRCNHCCYPTSTLFVMITMIETKKAVAQNLKHLILNIKLVLWSQFYHWLFSPHKNPCLWETRTTRHCWRGLFHRISKVYSLDVSGIEPKRVLMSAKPIYEGGRGPLGTACHGDSKQPNSVEKISNNQCLNQICLESVQKESIYNPSTREGGGHLAQLATVTANNQTL